ncbi:MAG: hypothetical protein ACYTGK_12710 [Planctomycetota bacterium]|jgi:hypothetical protein
MGLFAGGDDFLDLRSFLQTGLAVADQVHQKAQWRILSEWRKSRGPVNYPISFSQEWEFIRLGGNLYGINHAVPGQSAYGTVTNATSTSYEFELTENDYLGLGSGFPQGTWTGTAELDTGTTGLYVTVDPKTGDPVEYDTEFRAERVWVEINPRR